jgi:hypothetical protein
MRYKDELVNPDLLFPLADNNRDEILSVEFDGYIKNRCEGILQVMLENYIDWVKRYPKLKIFLDMSPEQKYDETALINYDDFLPMLCNEKLSEEEITKDTQLLLNKSNLNIQYNTIFEYALLNLLKKKFVKKVYLIRDEPFLENEKTYINSTFNEFKEKIEVYEGYSYGMIKFNPSITTIFLSDIEELKKIFTDYDTNTIKSKIFIIRTNIHNCVLQENDTDKIILTDKDLLTDMGMKKGALIGWMYPEYLFDETQEKLGVPCG